MLIYMWRPIFASLQLQTTQLLSKKYRSSGNTVLKLTDPRFELQTLVYAGDGALTGRFKYCSFCNFEKAISYRLYLCVDLRLVCRPVVLLSSLFPIYRPGQSCYSRRNRKNCRKNLDRNYAWGLWVEPGIKCDNFLIPKTYCFFFLRTSMRANKIPSRK